MGRLILATLYRAACSAGSSSAFAGAAASAAAFAFALPSAAGAATARANTERFASVGVGGLAELSGMNHLGLGLSHCRTLAGL